ncbi:uncharacterized protein LOC113332283 [Papaver somniferum]|nr:uncharacterized protein LOC113332283 [Papaver somniferum]
MITSLAHQQDSAPHNIPESSTPRERFVRVQEGMSVTMLSLAHNRIIEEQDPRTENVDNRSMTNSGIVGSTSPVVFSNPASQLSSPSTWMDFLSQQLDMSSGSGSGGQAMNRNVQQWMVDLNMALQLQQHDPRHHQHPYPHARAHQNPNPHVHPHPHHVPAYRMPSYYRRTVRLLQAALEIGQRPLPRLGTDVRDRLSQIQVLLLQLFRRIEMERNNAYEDDDDDDEDNGVDEEGVVIPGYLPRLIRRRDETMWVEIVDNFDYGDLVQLEDQIGNAEIGLTEEDVAQHLKRRRHPSLRMGATSSEVSPCCICQEEFADGEEIGMLDCGHDFHSGCIARWLLEKNLCPILKSTTLITGR